MEKQLAEQRCLSTKTQVVQQVVQAVVHGIVFDTSLQLKRCIAESANGR